MTAASAYLPVKRAIDAVAAACLLIVLAPLLAVVALAVRAGLGSPVLFRQERVTVGGRRFDLLKFRTMRPIDRARGWVTDEQRLTRLGRWLRATSLDELPSLWNILVGDMSVVGPRPLLPGYLPLFSAAQSRRHGVRAGLTGLAQVSGRNGLPWDERFDLDQRYVLLMGPVLDLTIVVQTAWTVLRRDGVDVDHAATTLDFAGPLRTPRLRLVPQPEGPSDGMPAPGVAVTRRWEARTPTDTRIARCTATVVRPDSPERIVADLEVVDLRADCDPQLVDDLILLLVNHLRAADAGGARIVVDARATHLLHALAAHGFEGEGGSGSTHGPGPARGDDAVRLTAVIRSVDEPIGPATPPAVRVRTTGAAIVPEAARAARAVRARAVRVGPARVGAER